MDLCQHLSFLLWGKEGGERESGAAECDLFSMAMEFPGGTLSQRHRFIVLCTSFQSRLVQEWSVIN